ncbi:hypothetical protein XH87_10410 [Bradyrhizobium sp. CCBAU 53415]|nr:hypothetical protein [Bradyrhizobium sp. CCBAU 53415]
MPRLAAPIFPTPQHARSGILLCLGHGLVETTHCTTYKLDSDGAESDVERLLHSSGLRVSVWTRRAAIYGSSCTMRLAMIIVLARRPRSLFAAAGRVEVRIKVPSGARAGNAHRVLLLQNFVRAEEAVSITSIMEALAFDKLTNPRNTMSRSL